MRLLIFGGEAVPPELAARLVSPEREVWNTYGPTEATVVACAALLDGIGARAHRPAARRLGARRGRRRGRVRSPTARSGELIIGGVGLARYLDPEKDAAKYSPMPTLGWERAYRSGDLVVFDREGLLFQGRADDQVKVGGRRIELGEIESALQALPAVSRARPPPCVATEAGNQVLVGYLAVTDGFDRAAARARLTEELPAALVPLLAVVDELPTRTSGKVDRAALPWPLPGVEPDAAGLGASAAWLAEQWQAVLGVPVLGAGRELLRPRRRVPRGRAAREPHPDPRPRVHGRRHLRPPPPRLDGRRARRAGARAGIGRVELPAARFRRREARSGCRRSPACRSSS